jgi:hypothetical protein
MWSKGQEARGGGEGEEPGREVRNGGKYWAGGGGGGGGSLPVSPYFSYNLKFKCLYTFGYTVALSHEISFFAMVHSTL